ncbi:scarecrow-like protein 15 [Gastrolobium bilobum]|uniref:scarecrow-like protein 15 n=1 Tax=Gastrolobium bilobum TaxID=150636 RepID=UPI002AB11F55|nr:scarecrow-like protein 15 [Gastrolobium bilobum]
MRVPVSSSPQANPKPNNATRTIALHSHTPPNLNNTYEPTSVLDLCRSPTTVPPENPTHHTRDRECVEVLDDHVLHDLDWDSIMKDLSFHDESKTTILQPNNINPCDLSVGPDFPPFDHAAEFTTLSDMYSNHNLGNYNLTTLDHSVHDFNGFDFIEELIRAADCFDNNQLQLAPVILERLNQRLRSPVGKPLHRAAFYFKEALQSLLSGSNRTPRLSSLVEIVHSIRTFKAFSGISPIPMFSIFTTNQALLEALHVHATTFMHVIDFDIGLGIQYASLMKEIAEKAESCKITSPPILRITAVVPEEYAVESTLVRQNLTQFAQELRIQVQVEFVLLRTFETLSFKAVKFLDGEKTAVLLSPAIFRRLVSAAAFLADVRRVSPSVVVFVDSEGWAEAAAASSFRRGVVSSLEFYSMMLESLDATMVGGAGEWVRRIEMLLLRPKILAAVEGAGRRVTPWREAFYGAGMRPVQLSQFADFQAECLLAKVQIRGFHVAKRQAELVLFWHERAMVVTSAWHC